jgi:hypothetical protein
MVEHSLQSNTSSMIEPSSESKSTSLPNRKIALPVPRVTGTYKQEQPIETDPNSTRILRNTLITLISIPISKIETTTIRARSPMI